MSKIIEDLKDKKLFSGLCYYCNEKPKQVSKPTSTRGSYTFNGINRLDNNKEYNLDNCVSCCKKCNYAKRDMSIEEFKNWIIKVYNNIESME